ncbi:hypothetical protein OEG84_25265 [Hoeflea sp. G2-23]|uniref:Transcriptional regulator n=1 Tax=Hoeflea algicola TaxID=2983763 RepID=A0ABT3ZFY7_9HYPH|nr:hypothetical protein [Hoeflea algicola]MCY0150593.1 hypothetical protein [Hoeflea algicola]MCY0150919.1 hypothetical protein [Hoeflea algicola]
MNSFRTIIDQWPSRGDFAADIGVTPQHATNIYTRDGIPSKYWAALVASASDRGIDGVTLDVLARIAAKGAGVAA